MKAQLTTLLAGSLLAACAVAGFAADRQESGAPRRVPVVTTNIVVVTNLVIVTNYVVVNEPPAPGSAPTATGSPGADENVFGMLWWKEGLNYQLTQRIRTGTTNDTGIPWLSAPSSAPWGCSRRWGG